MDYTMLTTVIAVIVFLIAGVFAGITSGLLGLGGGLVIIPVLNAVLPLMYDVNPHYILPICIQTSFAIIILNTTMSSYKQYKNNNIDYRGVMLVAPTLVIFAALTGQVVTGINPGYLKASFGLILVYNGIKMLFAKPIKFVESNEPVNLSVTKGIIAGSLIGTISGTAGISGGSFLGPFFHSCKMPIKKALGTSSACGVFIAISGTISYAVAGYNVDTGIPYTYGYFSLLAFVAFASTSIVGASYGVKLQKVLNARMVAKIFAIFLLVIAIDMFESAYSFIAHN